jgi:hypothetical protein
MNETIVRLVHAVEGWELPQSPVSFLGTWRQIQKLMDNVNTVASSANDTWLSVLNLGDTLVDIMKNHEREWEPVLDMLNKNYVASRFVTTCSRRSIFKQI